MQGAWFLRAIVPLLRGVTLLIVAVCFASLCVIFWQWRDWCSSASAEQRLLWVQVACHNGFLDGFVTGADLTCPGNKRAPFPLSHYADCSCPFNLLRSRSNFLVKALCFGRVLHPREQIRFVMGGKFWTEVVAGTVVVVFLKSGM